MNKHELDNYFLDFLDYLKREKNLSKNSLRAYKADLNGYLNFWGQLENNLDKKFKISHVVKKYRASLIKKNIKKSTVARKLSCLNSLETFLNSIGVRVEFKIVRPRVPLLQPTYLTVKEITYLLDELPLQDLPTRKPYRDKTILELLYATGMRASELMDVRIKDLCLEKKSVSIKSKKRKQRTVFFGLSTKKKLLNYLKVERKKVESENEYLFLSYREEPLVTRSLQRICNMFALFLKKNCRKRAVTPQILRHSFAMHMVEQGADLKDLEKLLGFSSPVSIEKYIK